MLYGHTQQTLLQVVNEVLYSIEQLQNQSKRQYGVEDVRAWKPIYAQWHVRDNFKVLR
jgi:hypothetical protein